MRLGNYELLRLLSTFMIVLLHVAAGSVALTMVDPNISFTLSNAMDSTTRYAVPLFVMLSGAFQLKKKENQEFIPYFIKIGKTILIPTLIWSFVYVIYQIGDRWYSYTLGELSYTEFTDLVTYFVTQWAKGAPFYHMWYLYMALGLFLITPILIRIMDRVSRGAIGFIGVGFVILGMIVTDVTVLPWPLKFIQYMGYYVLGYWIRENKQILMRWKIHAAIISFICFILIFYATEILVKSESEALNPFYFYGFLSPFVVIGSIMTFSFFSCFQFNNPWIEKIAGYSFNIYLVHALILDVLNKVINQIPLSMGSVERIPILTLTVFLLSLGFSAALEKIATLLHVLINKKLAQ